MSLANFVAENVRSIERAELTFHPGRNLIWGPNGSGKTSLLEAAFLLGRGRSFRTRNSERLIRYGQDRLIAFGRLGTTPERAIGVQISKSEGTIAKLDGSFVKSLAELSQAFAVQAIDPGIHRLVEEGSNRRRRWIDWLVFHVEPGFIENWTSYTRAVKQRNAALRHQPAQIGVWDAEVVRFGQLLNDSRQRVVDQLQVFWRDAVSRLAGLEVELGYSRGWPQDFSLAEALQHSLERDRAKGVTHVGPHRGDIRLRHAGRLARDVLSRGQQKLTAIAMTLAPLRMIQEVSGVAPTLLLDDPEAELDRQRLACFVEEVEHLDCQVIYTALHQADLFRAPDKVFHVEQGKVRPV